jgi:signal transduction histidine kinase
MKESNFSTKDKSLSFLTHELRNPLTNITLSVEILKLKLKNKEMQTYLEIIYRNSIQINELINEMIKNQQVKESME